MKKVHLKEDIFRIKNGKGYLLSNTCKACGQVFFPKVIFCPTCFGKEMNETVLSRQGKLYSYTICHMPAGSFTPPFVVGLIDLPEGVRVFAPLKVDSEQMLTVGTDMEVVIEELWEEDRTILGYRFLPVGQ